MSCVQQSGSYGMNVCQDQREDYMECLHHPKLVNIIFLLNLTLSVSDFCMFVDSFRCRLQDWMPYRNKSKN